MTADQRYSRQTAFAGLGREGQERLSASSAVVVGCGALGAAAAELLARAGVGRLRLIDRDVVEESNLPRQALYTEADAAAARPKAEAAAAHLAAINAECRVEARVAHVDAGNVADLIAGAGVVLDGTDNLPTRHLVNEACCRAGVPFLHGAVLGAYGCALVVLPGETPCLRCLQDELPAAGETATCASAGVIAPVVRLVAAWQVAEALKILAGRRDAVRRDLWACDLWENRFQSLSLAGGRDPRCRACSPTADFPLLTGREALAVGACGEAVRLALGRDIDLARFATDLGPHRITANEHLVRWSDGAVEATAFADGRVLVRGLADQTRARAWVDRWLG